MVSKEEFRAAMSKFATGVTVVTTVDDQGHPHSMTANSFTSVCLDPPVVLVCVGHNTHTYRYLEPSGRFGINILSQKQEAVGAYFARRPEDRTGGVEYSYSMVDGDIPMLDDSMAFFSCRVIGCHVYGDHTIYIGQVNEIRQNDASVPILFFRSRWCHLGEE